MTQHPRAGRTVNGIRGHLPMSPERDRLARRTAEVSRLDMLAVADLARPDGTEAEHRLTTIKAHLPVFVLLRTHAHYDYREVTGWTLPAVWDPRTADDRTSNDTRVALLGKPLTFAGDWIVAHLTEARPPHLIGVPL